MQDLNSEILVSLEQGDIEIRGEFLWGSNYTFLVRIHYQERELTAVYKPTKGVRPLWDFPQASLARREVAAYLVDCALGWGQVPPTVFRADAILGSGSIQLFIEHDPEYHYFNFNHSDQQRLRATALFDIIINNADRKGSHILIDPDNHLWLIDHGICFHTEDKLRTVVWDFVGEPISEQYCADIQRMIEMLNGKKDDRSQFTIQLAKHLSKNEIIALKSRAEKLLNNAAYPAPSRYYRPYPWPQL